MTFKTVQLRNLVVFLFYVSIFACKSSPPRIELVKSSKSGIHFSNQIIENDSINQLDNGNAFNGSGVGVGDFNNDGLQDIYFTSNMTSCKMYLNKGNFKFRDVTEVAGVEGEGKWCSGVSVVDINSDGLMDLYVSATIYRNPEKRKNMFYINQGIDDNGIPRFQNMAAEFGLADNSHTAQAAFFDYDNDGDLDVYLTVNEVNDRSSPYIFHKVVKDGSNSSTGKLYRNDWDELKKNPVFTDVSKEAGIQTEGYGNQTTIIDINNDGWKDIYVSNDYLSNDLMWINNRNGTFSEHLSDVFKHTSNSAMGNDAADINNDGLADFITLDMNPEDNFRKKMMLPPASYQFYQNSEKFGYNFQYVRNTLQLNQGSNKTGNGRDSLPVFSEIAYLAGVEGTDWSWTPLLCDFDNDGLRDLFIANGFPRDITDRDFMTFRSNAWATTPKSEMLNQVPEIKLHNYIFRNNGDLTFSDQSEKWGMTNLTFSNGAAYADFDNDGDIDLVVNNINDEASVYRNNTRELLPESSNYLKIKPEGERPNLNGIGVIVKIYYHGKMQVWENSPYRGYLSTSENIAHFGLGKDSVADSVIIKWQSGKVQILRNIKANQVLKVAEKDASVISISTDKENEISPLFTDVTNDLKVSFLHSEIDFIDFNIQKLIPHKFSEAGPKLVSGDINGDGLDDLISGGSAGNSAKMLLQKPDGTFIQKSLLTEKEILAKTWDDAGIALFDADLDGDNDLYVASGGYENQPLSGVYADHLYINDGRGNFNEQKGCIPENLVSKGCVTPCDFDMDGDTDLFISGCVDPWNYPKPVSSFIYRNDSEKGKIRFTDVSTEVAPSLKSIGMVFDAVFSDFNNDGWKDLVLAGEWMPVTFLQNNKGKFELLNDTVSAKNTGWWRSVAAGDFDNDGDEDFVAGNIGLNSFFKATEKYPVSIISGDFDNNGSYDAFPALYLKTSQQDSALMCYPSHGRDDIVKQMIRTRNKFQNYKSLAVATVDKLFTPEQYQKALKFSATNLKTSYIRNDGNGKFTVVPLPVQAQFSVVQSILTSDFDGDGNLDLLINGNDYGTDVLIGRYDALNGLFMKGDGKGNFKPLTLMESGFFVKGNGRSMTKFSNKRGEILVAAAQNNGPLIIFRVNKQ